MKKYFIGVLAALMLFAFTACEPQVTGWPTSKNVSYLTIEQVKDFVVGETATDDGFNVIIHYTDDTVSDPIPGVAKVGKEIDEKTPVTASITFSGDANATEAIPTTVEFKTVTGLSVNGYDVNNQDSTKTATVTLSYDSGSKTFAYGDIDLQVETWVDGEEKLTPVEGDVVTLYVTGYKFDGATYEDIPQNVAIGTYTHSEKTFIPSDLVVEYTYTVADSSPAVTYTSAPYAGDGYTYAVYYVDANGKKATSGEYAAALDSTDDYIVKNGATAPAAKEKTVGIKATDIVTIVDKKFGFEAEIQIPAGKNYIASAGTASLKTDEGEDARVFEPGQTLNASWFQVEANYAVDPNEKETEYFTKVSLVDDKVPAGLEASDTFSVTLAVYIGRNADEYKQVKVSGLQIDPEYVAPDAE